MLETAPFENVRPAGRSDAPYRLIEYGPVPPAAISVFEYGTPTLPGGSESGVSASSELKIDFTDAESTKIGSEVGRKRLGASGLDGCKQESERNEQPGHTSREKAGKTPVRHSSIRG